MWLLLSYSIFPYTTTHSQSWFCLQAGLVRHLWVRRGGVTMSGRYLLIAAVLLAVAVVLFTCTFTVCPVVPAFTHSFGVDSSLEKGVGLVILTPDGGQAWRKTVEAAVAKLGDAIPVEIAYGDGNPVAMHVAVERLKMREVERIVLIPLYISSHSTAMHRTRYVLGLDKTPDSMSEFVHPIALDMPFVLGDALDANPLVADVLKDRARAVSLTPAKETLIIVTESDGTPEDNALMRKDLMKLARVLKSGMGFRDVTFVIMQSDDSVVSGKELREAVQKANKKGKAVIIPLMLDESGVQKRINRHLNGMNYTFNSECLLPHDKMISWLKENINKQLIKLNWERFAGDGVIMST